MEIRWAGIEDVETLVTLRVDFLGTQRPFTVETEEQLRQQLRVYYTKHIPAGDFVAAIAFDGKAPAATAFLTYYEYPPNELNFAATRAVVANVFTYPQYQRRGLASRLMAMLVEDAQKRGATCIDLFATEAGRPVYQKLGFASIKDQAMRLTL